MLDERALDTLFRSARTANAFLDRPVTDEQIHRLYELLKWGPTSANASPGRFLFVRSREAKEKLRPALSEGNREKTMKAPVTVVVAHHARFYDRLPFLFPNNPAARDWFAGPANEAAAAAAAFRNGTLQGAYLILAARAIGLDCGPMSGFDNAKVDAAFFPEGDWKSNFLCNLGYADPAGIFPRNPRLPFDEACRIE